MSKTKERIVTETLIGMQLEAWYKQDELEKIGISIDFYERLDFAAVAFDLIGFPKTCQDSDNVFYRDYLYNIVYDIHQQQKNPNKVSEIADKLYIEYEAYQTSI